jgi:16S rRNA (cytosine967-C5)-methyltransferase
MSNDFISDLKRPAPARESNQRPDQLNKREVTLAAQIIAEASKDTPADSVLRRVFKGERELSRESSGRIARAVFARYRWQSWIDLNLRLSAQLQEAWTLAGEYADKPSAFPDQELMEKAVPSWISEQVAVSPVWVRCLQSEPKIWLRARTGKGPALASALGNAQAAGEGRLADALLYSGQQDLFRTPEFHSGEFEIQDIHSQAVSWIASPAAGETWWDACAGEGGKTLHFSELMQNKGLIWASDRSVRRLTRLRQRAARAKAFNYRVVEWEGGPKPPTKTRFDGVLVDAPCSNVGTWQRNPHARWTLDKKDVEELAEIQLRLMLTAGGSVKPGGRLIYSVCTLTRAETVEVIERFLAERTDFRPLLVRNPFSESAPPQAQHSFWPQERDGNGMFISALQKIGAA